MIKPICSPCSSSHQRIQQPAMKKKRRRIQARKSRAAIKEHPHQGSVEIKKDLFTLKTKALSHSVKDLHQMKEIRKSAAFYILSLLHTKQEEHCAKICHLQREMKILSSCQIKISM
ncbi:hypothetical protein Droror1_Dr00004361 [Drosera rotundifolia]